MTYYIIAAVAFLFLVLILLKAISTGVEKPENLKPEILVFVSLLSITTVFCLCLGLMDTTFALYFAN